MTDLIRELHSHASRRSVEGMARFGINPSGTLGVSMPVLRVIAQRVGRDHIQALHLWRSGIHEARILASLVDDPAAVTKRQMELWAADLDSWDVCDQLCQNLFGKVPYAREMALRWSTAKREFVKRAGFVLMARLAQKDPTIPDAVFKRFLKIVEREAWDGRHYVKKAANWAVRQIGKRNPDLHAAAIACATALAGHVSGSARWIGSDALRELRSLTVTARPIQRERGNDRTRKRSPRQ